MKTTDQRAGEAIARAVLMRLILEVNPECDALADEGNALLDAEPRHWPTIAAWLKRACGDLYAREVYKRLVKDGKMDPP